MAPPPVKAIPKKDSKTKVPTKKKAKVVVPTRYFGFDDHTDIKDLSKKPLRIKQLVAFIPKDDDDNPLDSADVTIEIYEMKAGSGERDSSLMLTIKGKVTKAENYNFVVDEISQDPAKLAQAKKPKSTGGAELFMTSKLEVVGVDDKARGKTGLEFVLPPMEYDETLELQMGETIPGMLKGEAKITFSTYTDMLSALGVTATDRTSGIVNGGPHKGNMHHVVLHCMCNIVKPKDPNESFDMDACVQIFKDLGFNAHYIIDRDGTVVQPVDIHNVSYHAFSEQNTSAHGLYAANSLSIGIELMGIPDQFRDPKIAEYEKLKKEFETKKAKLEADKKVLQDALEKREGEKAAGKTKVKVLGKDVDVDVAIDAIKKALTEQQAKIDALKPDQFVGDWEKFTKDTDADGVPLVFKYTDKQYAALGKILEVVSRRYAYQVIATHHYISPSRKTDPGIYFDWSKVTPHLLPGSLSGDESHGGGVYVVKI